MNGRPVWLASYSLRKNGRIVATGRWSQQQRRAATEALKGLLREVGDESAMRVFRMNVTMCLHKALSQRDEVAIPVSWFSGPGRDVAGIPIEIIEETCSSPSTRPCDNPGRLVIDRSRPDLWIPTPCGECPSCVARAGA